MIEAMIGTTVAHYEILELLGSGGMGVVYKARDLRLGRLVALKFLPLHRGHDERARARLEAEARAASALDHANICGLHEIGETEDGRLYLAMSFYDGRSLKQELLARGLSIDQAVDIAIQIGRGLTRAHEAGIVHRDIKPANVMITNRGEVKIVDFGLAVLEGDAGLTASGAAVGTVFYMSPEQALAEEVDTRTDLWSLGVVLYEMLTAELPFPGRQAHVVTLGILNRTPTPPSELQPEIPDALEKLVLCLLEKSRDDRPGGASEVVETLEEIRGSTEPADLTVSLWRHRLASHRRAWKRHGWAALIVLLGAALAFVVAFVLARGVRPPHDFGKVAVLPFENFTGDPDDDYLSDGIASGLLNRLSAAPGLQLLGRAESWHLRASGASALELGERLGVGALIEGGIQTHEQGLQVTTNLIDARTGRIVWSGTVLGGRDELLNIQRELADRLLGVFSITLSPRERKRFAADPTRSFEAYDAYLKGMRLIEESAGESGSKQTAVESFRRAINSDPGFAQAHAGLSTALMVAAREERNPAAYPEAEAAALLALELDPELFEAKLALARVQIDTGRATEAILPLEGLLDEHPSPDVVHRTLGWAHRANGDLDAAEDSFRAAVNSQRENWYNWYVLGGILRDRGRVDEARRAYEQALRLAPAGVTRPQENLAMLELGEGRFDAAIVIYEAMERPVQSALSAGNLGTAYFFSSRPDKWQKAEEFYRLAVQLSPRNDEARRNLADLYLETGRDSEAQAEYVRALRIVEEVLESDPDNLDMKLRRVFYSARAKSCPQALQQASQLAKATATTAESAHRLAYVFALCGDRKRALSFIQEAVQLGTSPALIRQEAEFASLRGSPDLERILSAVSGH